MQHNTDLPLYTETSITSYLYTHAYILIDDNQNFVNKKS